MLLYFDTATYEVDLLYGYTPTVDRGISYSVTSEGFVGVVDRDLNVITTSFTIQSGIADMRAIDARLSTTGTFQVLTRDGERIMGPEHIGTVDGLPTLQTLTVVSRGRILRKTDMQYSMEITASIPYASCLLDPATDLTDPSWTTIRYADQYTGGYGGQQRATVLMDATPVSSTTATNVHETTVQSAMTNAEAARWSYYLNNNLGRRVQSVTRASMYLDLFNKTSFTTYKFFVDAPLFQHVGFDYWLFTARLILAENESA